MERADFDVGMMLTCRSLSTLARLRLRRRRRPAGEQVAHCMTLPDAHPLCTKSVMSAVAPVGSLAGALGGACRSAQAAPLVGACGVPCGGWMGHCPLVSQVQTQLAPNRAGSLHVA